MNHHEIEQEESNLRQLYTASQGHRDSYFLETALIFIARQLLEIRKIAATIPSGDRQGGGKSTTL